MSKTRRRHIRTARTNSGKESLHRSATNEVYVGRRCDSHDNARHRHEQERHALVSASELESVSASDLLLNCHCLEGRKQLRKQSSGWRQLELLLLLLLLLLKEQR